MRPRRSILRTIAVVTLAVASATPAARAGETTLWYDWPAADWNAALPVGNGRLGAMVFGDAAAERLQLNDDTIWSGNRSDYDRAGARPRVDEARRLLFAGKPAEANAILTKDVLGDRPLGHYQPLGDLRIEMADGGDVTDYRRELDLDAAVARVSFRRGDVAFTREVFSSQPDKVLVARLAADRPGAISCRVKLDRVEHASTEAHGTDGLAMRGQADADMPATAGVKFAAIARAIAEGGTVKVEGDAIVVTNADALTILVSSGSDFDRKDADPFAEATLPIDLAVEKAYATLRADHVADHRRLFRRMRLDLGTDASPAANEKPTGARIAALANGGPADPGLAELTFQYGRYLLIASSRPGDLAANLQGIWNEHLAPPWFGGWHTDINVQMNYWLAEPSNLSECHEPMFALIDRLRAPGRKSAREVFDLPGVFIAHRTNGNYFTAPVKGLNLWPPAYGWMVQHPYEHYRFTLDRDFLKDRAFPMLRDAAEFYVAWLVPDPSTGLLVSGPSVSPENSYVLPDGTYHQVSMGPAMDQQVIAEVFDNFVEAAGMLGVDDELVRRVRDARAKLAPTLISPKTGRVQEWAIDYAEREPGHRHMSPLYAVMPGWQITSRGTPALAEASRKLIAARVTAGQTDKKLNLSDASNTGWSLAHNLLLWARLHEPARAADAFDAWMRRCLYPNLLNVCRSGTKKWFQIDGNLGVPTGMIEMLVQSHAGEIELLPALPASWPDGRIVGVRARGAVGVDVEWRGGKLTRATLKGDVGGPVRVRVGEMVKTIETTAGDAVMIDGNLAVVGR